MVRFRKALLLVPLSMLVPNGAVADHGPIMCGAAQVTICAGSYAKAQVFCDKQTVGFLTVVSCAGVSFHGGSGLSTVGLAGDVTWSGSASCSDACSAPSCSVSDSLAWPGLGDNGRASSQVCQFPAVVQLGGCLTYSVEAVTTDASARAYLAGVQLDTASSLDTSTAASSICA